jgi:tetratricopeptide (TPR) repeat protein
MQNKYSEAAEALEKARKQSEQIGDQQGVAFSLNNLAILYKKQGLYEDAKATIGDALFRFQNIGDLPYNIGYCFYEYGLIFRDEGCYSEARTRFEEARDTFALQEELQPQVEMCLRALSQLDDLEEARSNNV